MDEASSLTQGLEIAAESARTIHNAEGMGTEVIDQAVAEWKLILDYTAKVLLYQSLDSATVHNFPDFSAAPKQWPGLGKRKRELRMAEVDALYDRYVIGPATLADWAGDHAGELDELGRVSAHWRRGHFRLQPHGPRASLRKVMFIMPTLVRADRLAEA